MKTLFTSVKYLFVLFLFKLVPPCNEATMLVSRSFDTKLSFKERFQLKCHLLICAACNRFSKQIHFLQKIIHEHGHLHVHTHDEETPLRATLSDEARKRLKNEVSSRL